VYFGKWKSTRTFPLPSSATSCNSDYAGLAGVMGMFLQRLRSSAAGLNGIQFFVQQDEIDRSGDGF